VENAVEERMMSDRKIGCLLSGGLDSSLISSIVARKAKNPKDIETFSIGLKGSPDLIAAQEVADHIGTTHHSIELTEQDFIAALEETIYITGSYDITTIRASVGHQLISNWVKDNSEVKVLFTGETIDEMGSYLYFQQAPSEEAFQEEALRLLKDIHYFDMLRGDRSISSAGLEARVPFADLSFIKYYMGIDPKQRMFDGNHKIEKHLLRKAFEDGDYLPNHILWRRKNGFSDSVSDKNRSWSTIIEEYVDLIIADDKYQSERLQFDHLRPETKESFYIRKTYEKYYGHNTQATPYMWLPKWCGDVKDPSARTLSIYEAD
jgi:asparagine synthase (glutamine-hydrolysing)